MTPPFAAVPIRAPFAPHLASALIFRERLSPAVAFVTHDAQQATAARAPDFECIGVQIDCENTG